VSESLVAVKAYFQLKNMGDKSKDGIHIGKSKDSDTGSKCLKFQKKLTDR
jgi:hypothetical protein